MFNYSPRALYSLLGSLRREEAALEEVDLTTPLGTNLTEIVGKIGTGMMADILYLPIQFQGRYVLPNDPNLHVYQIIGSSTVNNQEMIPGDVMAIGSNEVFIHTNPRTPCVFAILSYEQLRVLQEAESEPSSDLVKQIMVEDYLSQELCTEIIESLYGSSEQQYSRVLTDYTTNKTELQLKVRKTETMYSRKREMVEQVLADIVTNKVEVFYKETMEFWNMPVLLRYPVGGFFVPHVDGETFKDGGWHRIYDRDYTLVAFLNEDYEGGRLVFPELDFAVTPKTGRVVAFPADHRFRHGAEETTSGIRFQLVSWLTAYGTVRTNTPPNPSVIYRTW